MQDAGIFDDHSCARYVLQPRKGMKATISAFSPFSAWESSISWQPSPQASPSSSTPPLPPSPPGLGTPPSPPPCSCWALPPASGCRGNSKSRSSESAEGILAGLGGASACRDWAARSGHHRPLHCRLDRSGTRHPASEGHLLDRPGSHPLVRPFCHPQRGWNPISHQARVVRRRGSEEPWRKFAPDRKKASFPPVVPRSFPA